MSATAAVEAPGLAIRERPLAAAWELVALEPAAAARLGLPVAPGAVLQGAGALRALHFAPDRYLVLAPDDAACESPMVAALDADAGAVATRVDGKRVCLELSGPGAAALLCASLDLESVMQGRECAAVCLFDCPAILVRSGAEWVVLLQSSYREAFYTCVRQLLEPHER